MTDGCALEKWTWTEEDFERMGWHDAQVHAFAFLPESWELLLDLDYILKWVAPSEGESHYSFWSAPATLIFENVADLKIELEPPEDLRDLVWVPGRLQFANGGESVALVPTRYPGSASSPDGLIALARKTTWEETGADTHHGLGQRVFATDAEEVPILEVRTIALDAVEETDTHVAEDHA